MASQLIIPTGKLEFRESALELFRHQAVECDIYRQFVELLGCDISDVNSLEKIPFLPVSLFKDHKVVTGQFTPEAVFASSGTTGTIPSKHHVKSLALYEESFVKGFTHFYGDPSEYVILALLPQYIERGDSSLVYMADRLIKMSGRQESGFYLNNYEELIRHIDAVRVPSVGGQEIGAAPKILLLGVTWALLKLAHDYAPDLSGVTVMETGGMKGMHREMVRAELHNELCSAFNITEVHSEYGMTELLSQGYSSGGGLFSTPPWMKVMIADVNNPLSLSDHPGAAGAINIIDLANRHSCAFIATADLGRLHDGGQFEVTGRFDNSEVRGCNLLT